MIVTCKEFAKRLVQLAVLVALQISYVHPFVVATHDVVVLGFESLVKVEGLIGWSQQRVFNLVNRRLNILCFNQNEVVQVQHFANL